MRAAGFSLLEALLVLALAGLLGSLAVARWPGPGLGALAADLPAALAQGLQRARARNRTVWLDPVRAGEVPGLVLPPGVRWGAGPAPPPPGMAPPCRAARVGRAHERVALAPRGTARASAWFLTDGREVLCCRLNDQGGAHLLRWSRARGWRGLP